MNIFQKHIDYLKDNPEGYWFKRKLYGWGWTPARWQGWVVLLVFLLVFAAGEILFMNQMAAAPSNTKITIYVVFVFVTVASLIYVCYKKGEKPRWQWGKDK